MSGHFCKKRMIDCSKIITILLHKPRLRKKRDSITIQKKINLSGSKVKSMGIAGLIFNKAPRPTNGEIKYDKSQTKKGILPRDQQQLQERLEFSF